MPYLYSVDSKVSIRPGSDMSYLFTEIGSWMAAIETSSPIDITKELDGVDLKPKIKTSPLRLPAKALHLGPLLFAAPRAVEYGCQYRWSGSWYNTVAKMEDDELEREDCTDIVGHSEAERVGIGRIEKGPIPKAIKSEHRVHQPGAMERSEDIHVQIDGHKLRRRSKGDVHMLQRWIRQSATEAAWHPGRVETLSG